MNLELKQKKESPYPFAMPGTLKLDFKQAIATYNQKHNTKHTMLTILIGKVREFIKEVEGS
ncbi:MAG: hypothetical protein KKH44_07825 [Bacteroidetes bacterium]|nr:hypothetical protein [Bacteroidota bacterium]